MGTQLSSVTLVEDRLIQPEPVSSYEEYVEVCNRWGMSERYISIKIWNQLRRSEEICNALRGLSFTDFDGIVWVTNITDSVDDATAWFRMLEKVRAKFPNTNHLGSRSILREMKERYSDNSPDTYFESVDTGNRIIDRCPEIVWFFLHLYGENKARKVLETLKSLDPNTSLSSMHSLFERWDEFKDYPTSWALNLLKLDQVLYQD